jgi:hypothetical protein
MIREPTVEFFSLLIGQEQLVRVRRDAVPEALDELETLGDRKLAKIIDRDAHTTGNVLPPAAIPAL